MGVWEMRPNPEADETLINPNREEALFALALEKPAAMCDVRCAMCEGAAAGDRDPRQRRHQHVDSPRD